MSTTEAKARQIIQALEARPELFFEILRIIQDEFVVAGPWTVNDDQVWHRPDPFGDATTVVERYAGTGPKWVWRLANETSRTKYDSADEAKAAVDVMMRTHGFILV